MAVVVPTILAETPDDFAARIDRVKKFAKRVHVDVADGVFAPHKTVGLSQVYGVDGAQLDLHLMVAHPEDQFEKALSVEPQLVICHFESDGDVAGLLQRFREVGIKAGLAIKRDTNIDQVQDLLQRIDHLLVFTGTLGFNHGDFDASKLEKISQAKAINPNLEVAVDGGINAANAKLAIEAGADVLNTGSFVHEAAEPKTAFNELQVIAGGLT